MLKVFLYILMYLGMSIGIATALLFLFYLTDNIIFICFGLHLEDVFSEIWRMK